MNRTGLSFRRQIGGTALVLSSPVSTRLPPTPPVCEAVYGERFRLHNLSPQEGSRKKKTRKGRGYSAGQGGSCGFGMRGQKSRSGPGPRPGFEGGQNPLYRRLPKLRGVAGGMPSGRKNFVTINLKDLNQKFIEGDVVDLEALKAKRLIHASGKERKLPLKVLGKGDLKIPLEIKATKFSEGAVKKIEEAGGTITQIPMKPKWTQELHEQMIAEGKIKPKKTKRYYYLQTLSSTEN
eukprot:g4990.t1